MSAVAERPKVETANELRYTPEDLVTQPALKHCELVDGRLVEKEGGFLTSIVAGVMYALIWNYVHAHSLGWVPLPECGYQCFPDDPRKVRKPDGSFVSISRLSAAEVQEGHLRIAPDLAVEVVSPHDGSSDVLVKVAEYLSAGVRLVWVLHPPTATVHVYRLDRTVTWLHEQDELTGKDVLPGFTCRVADLFPVRPQVENPSGA